MPVTEDVNRAKLPRGAAGDGAEEHPAPPTAPPASSPSADAGGGLRVLQSLRGNQVASRLFEMDSTGILVALIALIVIVGILHPGFFAPTQLLDVVQSSVYVAILAAGMAFLLAMLEIDLSVGAVFALTMVVAAMLDQSGMNPWLAASLAVILGAFLGLVNALLVQFIGIPAIVATLGTLSMYSGLAIALTGGEQITGFATNNSFFTVVGGDIFGIPFSVYALVVIVIVLTAVLRLTPFGYRVRSIGSNPDAAIFSGISIRRVRIQALVMMGTLAGIAGVLGLGYYFSGDPDIGTNFELTAIAAAVIGGTSLRGGNATVLGAVLGAILLGMVNSALIFFNVPLNWTSFATGAVIIIAVSVDSLLRHQRGRRQSGLGM